LGGKGIVKIPRNIRKDLYYIVRSALFLLMSYRQENFFRSHCDYLTPVEVAMRHHLSAEEILKGDALSYRLAVVLASADVDYAVQLYALGQLVGTILGPDAPPDVREFWTSAMSTGTGDGRRA
jgi:hypothetical protein